MVFLISSLSIKNNTQESAVAKSNTFQALPSCVPLQLVDIFNDSTIKQYFHEQYFCKRIEHQGRTQESAVVKSINFCCFHLQLLLFFLFDDFLTIFLQCIQESDLYRSQKKKTLTKGFGRR